MSGSKRGEHSALGLIGTVAVAVVGIASYWAMFYSAGYGSGYNDQKAKIEAKHYASDTTNQIERDCSAKTGEVARKCITDIVKAEREGQRNERDLAAQLKAADWAMWAAIIAGAQLLATIIGLYFVKRTLDATLEAVEDTGKATKAMEEANRIARFAQMHNRSEETRNRVRQQLSEQRQLRAYVSLEPGGVHIAERGMHSLPVNIINGGQTPATDLTWSGDIVFWEGDPREFDPAKNGRLGDQTATSDSTLGPSSNRFNYAYLDEGVAKPFWDRLARKEVAIIHYGKLAYKDVFNAEHCTMFAFYHWGDELSDAESKRCRFGNNAT